MNQTLVFSMEAWLGGHTNTIAIFGIHPHSNTSGKSRKLDGDIQSSHLKTKVLEKPAVLNFS